MKKKLLPLFVLCFALMTAFAPMTASATTPEFSAESLNRRIPWPRTLIVTYCWGTTELHPGCDQQAVTLYKNRTAEASAPGFGTVQGNWTFDRNTKHFTMDFTLQTGESVQYEATKRGRRYKDGSMTAFDAQGNPLMSGYWQGELQR